MCVCVFCDGRIELSQQSVTTLLLLSDLTGVSVKVGHIQFGKFEVLTAVLMEISFFADVMSCTWANISRPFERRCTASRK